jgi:hypothetical protein
LKNDDGLTDEPSFLMNPSTSAIQRRRSTYKMDTTVISMMDDMNILPDMMLE